MSPTLQVEGSHPLRGEIMMRGAKNFVSKAMVASLLADTLSELYNVSLIRDTDVVLDLLSPHDVQIGLDQDRGTLRMNPSSVRIASRSGIDTLASASRIPILFYGPLLHQLGEAFIPELGGYAIGDRPIDFHLEALRKFGTIVDKQPDDVHIECPSLGLHDVIIELPSPSVGATEQTLLTAVCDEDVAILKGAAIEPEVFDLTNVLQKMGVITSVDTDRMIRTKDVIRLNGYRHTVLPGRIEAAPWGAAALAAYGDIYVHGAHQPDMTTFLNTFRRVGGAFNIDADGIRFYHPGELLHSIALETAVYPGLMMGWQQPLVVALTQAEGLSIVYETVYENCFGFTEALYKMGANIQVYRERLDGTPCRFGQKNYYYSAVISGPTPLYSADIEVPDLRDGFSHLIAILAALGTSTMSDISAISRGYEYFTHKLHRLDVRVRYLDA